MNNSITQPKKQQSWDLNSDQPDSKSHALVLEAEGKEGPNGRLEWNAYDLVTSETSERTEGPKYSQLVSPCKVVMKEFGTGIPDIQDNKRGR